MTFLKILNCSNSSFHQYFHSTENCHCYLFIRNLNCFQLRNLNCFQHLKHSILHSWDDYFIDSFAHYLEFEMRIHLFIIHCYQIGKKFLDYDLIGFDKSINLTKQFSLHLNCELISIFWISQILLFEVKLWKDILILFNDS